MTIKDIAKLAGVGISTVSRAINNDPGISAETREKILKIVRENNYIPNNSARNLKMTESNTIALLVRGVENYFFQDMYGFIQNELEDRGYDYLLYAVGEEEDMTSVATEVAMEKRLKGIIIMGGRLEKSERRLKELPVPYVLCAVAIPLDMSPVSTVTVGVDDEKEGHDAVSYLISRGHRRIAIITATKNDTAVGAKRLAGYKRALSENGLEIDESLIGYSYEGVPEFSAENGYRAARDLLERTDFTALFCISDIMALGAYKAIAESGRSVPEDISVMGFDGIDLAGYFHPSLTTMVQPREKMARSAVRHIVRLIEGQEVEKEAFYDAKLIERDSVIVV